MKTITIDLKSLCLGAAVMGAMLLMANTPAAPPPPEPTNEVRRFQAVISEHGTVILDTKTGRFTVERTSIGGLRWIKGDFEEIM